MLPTSGLPRLILLALIAPFLAISHPALAKEKSLANEVNVFIGTANADVRATDPVPAGERGGTFPGATLPFGMIQWTPMTPSDGGKDRPIGYIYSENIITGFPLTQMSGAGCDGNSGEIPILPLSGTGDFAPTFSHANEVGSPGAYKVRFDNGIVAELTVTLRTGLGRFTFPSNAPDKASQTPGFLIDASRTNLFPATQGRVVVTGKRKLSVETRGGGFCGAPKYSVFAAIEFDRDIDLVATKIEATGRAIIRFLPAPPNSRSTVIQMKVGLSYVSAEGAAQNVIVENKGWNFDALEARATEVWNRRLATISITGGDPSARRQFYSAFYHSLLSPNVNSDHDGRYLGFDNQIHQTQRGHSHYANYSNWDTYRSQTPLLALLFPAEASDMMQTLVDDGALCGAIPRWAPINIDWGIMPGDSGVPVISGAYAFGARGFDAEQALRLMKRAGNKVGARCGNTIPRDSDERMADHLARGYVSLDRGWWAGSITHEFASVDFSIATLAKALGDESGYRQFLARSAQWKNLFDPVSAQLLPKRDDGTFERQPKPNEHMVEGNAEQYTWMVTHDMDALIGLIGGEQQVQDRLDRYFSNLNAGMTPPHFYLGNEPSFASPWLYNWTKAPWKTQRTVRAILSGDPLLGAKPVFSDTPGGLPGNDDLGAISSWYVWASIGLYPAITGVGGVAVNAPNFSDIKVSYADGQKSLRITSTCGASLQRCAAFHGHYIQSARIGASSLDRPWIDLGHDLSPHDTLSFHMAPAISAWGVRPVSEMPSYGLKGFTTLQAAFNARAFGKEGEPLSEEGEGLSFDGQGLRYRLPEVALNVGGITLGPHELGWDNMIVQGQQIVLPPTKGATTLSLVGSSSFVAASGVLELLYSDGSSVQTKLAFPLWLQANPADTQDSRSLGPVLGRDGKAGPQEAFLYRRAVQLDPEKTLTEIRFPSSTTGGRMHIFAMEIQ